jgi:hypothetical protein
MKKYLFYNHTSFSSGGNAPSYIYRLLSELYHPLDVQLWWEKMALY